MNPTVKKVDDYDYAKCLEIARDLSEWFNERGIDRMAVDLRAYETYGAYLDGELVGFVALKFDDGLAEIVWMAVERKYQGRSIGTMLLDFVEEVARGRGARLIVVKTNGDPDCQPYAKTRRFYEKRGFVSVLVIDPYPEWGEPMALYVKPVC